MDGEKGGWGEGEEGRRWCVALLICLMLMVLFYSLSRIHCYYGFFFLPVGKYLPHPTSGMRSYQHLSKRGVSTLELREFRGMIKLLSNCYCHQQLISSTHLRIILSLRVHI